MGEAHLVEGRHHVYHLRVELRQLAAHLRHHRTAGCTSCSRGVRWQDGQRGKGPAKRLPPKFVNQTVDHLRTARAARSTPAEQPSTTRARRARWDIITSQATADYTSRSDCGVRSAPAEQPSPCAHRCGTVLRTGASAPAWSVIIADAEAGAVWVL